MKKVLFLVAVSFSFISASAVAGENCIYGQKTLAKAAIKDALIAENNVEKVDPALLAVLKKQQAAKEMLNPVATFN